MVFVGAGEPDTDAASPATPPDVAEEKARAQKATIPVVPESPFRCLPIGLFPYCSRVPPVLAMRMRGLEPPRGCPHTDLNRARLPIPPHPRGGTV
jgi:hypothetical protein